MTADSILAVANDPTLNVYNPTDYKEKVELFKHEQLDEDHRALNVLGTFRPRPYQIKSMNFMLQRNPDGSFKDGLRAALCEHRRAGKTIRTLKIILMRMLQKPGLYFMVYPTLNQARKVMWDGLAYNEKKEAYKVIETIPPELWKRKDNHLMSLELHNGSILQLVGAVGVDGTPDHLRGANPIFAGFDEFQNMNPEVWGAVISPVFMENGGSAMFTFTPNGRDHAYRLLMSYMKYYADDPNGRFFGEILDITKTKRHDGTPVISEEYLQELRDQGIPEEYIQREFYCSFEVANKGSFYGDVLDQAYKENRITNVKYDAGYPVFAAWDLGIGTNDFTAIWFYQKINPNCTNLINYLEFENRSLLSIFPMLKILPYPIRAHFMPWDVNAKDQVTGLTKIQRLEDADVSDCPLERVKRVSVQHGIDLIRNHFRTYYFDKAACALGIERVRKYSKKKDMTTGFYTNRPIHDEASHGCDALRTMVNAEDEGLLSNYTDILNEGSSQYDYCLSED
jgi:phage terminase large subunit